jgi:hypothetical protein
MPSVEQIIKEQFEKLFEVDDWPLFKETADSLLCEAAHIKTTDMPFATERKLLARNSRKRLLIGIGVELLLKAVYLKNGYSINKRQEDKSTRGFPFTIQHARSIAMELSDSYTLSALVDNLSKVLRLKDEQRALKGLRIAKVFRNKEGHLVTRIHEFDVANYRDIEASLVLLYEQAFAERLEVRISFKEGEEAKWSVLSMAAKN